MNKRFELNVAEKDSVIWKKLKEHLEAKLDVCRKQNDSELDEAETSRLRGKIALIKELLGYDPALSATDGNAGGKVK